MVLYIPKPLWKSFKSDKDQEDANCDFITTTTTTTTVNSTTTQPNPATQRGRSHSRPSKKHRGPEIHITAPPCPAAVAPGTNGDELPYDDMLLAVPLPSQHEIGKVFATATSSVTLRKLSPVEFFPTLDALSAVGRKTGEGKEERPEGYIMSSRRSLKALTSSTAVRHLLRPTKIMLPDGRTEPAKAALARTLSLSRCRATKRVYVPRLRASQDSLLPTPASRRRASGVWVRDRQGNPFWMNGMLTRDDEPDGPVATTPRTVLVGREGTPELAVSVAAFSRESKRRFGKVRLSVK